MTDDIAFVGADVFDGRYVLRDKAVLLKDLRPIVMPLDILPEACTRIPLGGGTLMPGFVDLQVNGGGGVMFNDAPSLHTLRIIAEAHRRLGTAAILPTLITDTPAKTTAAIQAARAAIDTGVHGILGLHLEGPHLAVSRKGAHDASLIRPMTQADCAELTQAARDLPNLMITVAPEAVSCAQITALTEAGVIVFLGHSDAGYDVACAAYAAGAKGATHLFNAMSGLASREPGMVGAALNTPTAAAGLIADGVHVHPATIRSALAAKKGPEQIFLVTDAMATAGSDITGFELGGRYIQRHDGRLTLSDGTLAGADLSMAQALRVMIEDVGDTPEAAYQRATSLPSGLLRAPKGFGHWPIDLDDLIYLSDDFTVQSAASVLSH